MVKMECSSCKAVLQLALQVGLVGKVSQVQPSQQQQADKPSLQILVAVDGEATREIIREILVQGGYGVLESSNGKEALALLEKHHPPLAILDVGLPQMFGFEVCEIIKRRESLKTVKVILIAAIHDKDTYKREPKTLYGADDYIERHRLQQDLLSKIEKLLDQKRPSVAVKKQPETPRGNTTIQPPPSPLAEKPPPAAKPPEPNLGPEHETARRLARIIVSDIALYNAEKVKEALQNNSFYEMLKDEIEEGRKLYNERVLASVRSNTDYFQDALENYIKGKVKV
jgi:CheY-like chemotaxis protein